MSIHSTVCSLTAHEVLSISSVGKCADKAGRILSTRCVKLSISPQGWKAVATDSYVVVEVGVARPLEDWGGDLSEVTVILWADTWAQIEKALPRSSRTAADQVRFEITSTDGLPSQVEVHAGSETLSFTPAVLPGPFPPLERLLFTDQELAEKSDLLIDIDFLTRVAKATVPSQFAFTPKNRSNKFHLSFAPGPKGNIFLRREMLADSETFRATAVPFVPWK